MRPGDLGSTVAGLQRQLNAIGFKIDVTAVYDAATEAAVIDYQQRSGLVADGIAGRKTIDTLLHGRNPRLLSDADLVKTADRLGVQVAAIKAINEVESCGHGFLDDGRPVILYERHVAFERLAERSDRSAALACAERSPNIINPKRGGYTGGASEWSRLATARQILIDYPEISEESCSWGQFQIMGYHWQALGYESIGAFVAEMARNEAAQLEAFARFIESEPALLKALKARKWPDFARGYNGPDYKRNLYDVKLARAYERLSSAQEPA